MGFEFADHRTIALTSALVSPLAKERWAIANNAAFKRAMAIVQIPAELDELAVTLFHRDDLHLDHPPNER